MRQRYKDIAGHKFGRLTALRFVGHSENRNAVWECACDCGKAHIAEGRSLRSGNIQSCGCLQINSPVRAAANRKRLMTHGMTRTLTGQSWMAMLTRCYNPNVAAFKDYGGRGIRVCEFIRASPLNLVLIIAERPSRNITLDRINVNAGYNCGTCAECLANGWKLNVRWADKAEQAGNTTRNVLYRIDDQTLCAAEWARRKRMNVGTFRRQFSDCLVKEVYYAPTLLS